MGYEEKNMKKCLIISNGPVPTPEHSKVEGGGLRCWGLAKGIAANSQEVEVSVAYQDSYKKDNFTNKFESINIVTWKLEDVSDLIQDYETIIVSYCMGELSNKVSEDIRPDQQLILDCYVPIYVEVSARDTNDIDREYSTFSSDVGRWAEVLSRGDLFLCASEPQRMYYRGVLSAVGRINPVTYNEDLLLVVPYGIYREEPVSKEKPITKIIGVQKVQPKKILWFGGIYPWFDLRNLVDAVKILNKDFPAKLIIVGAKNPFNDHPDFTRPYDELMEHINSDPESKKQVVTQDWVEFEKRADWYLDSDLVVVINKTGQENDLAWRTRLVDFLWADLPILTNGGDPLSNILFDNDAAFKLEGLTAESIAASLDKTLSNDLTKTQSNLKQLKKQFYWDSITTSLTNAIESHQQAADLKMYGDFKTNSLTSNSPNGPNKMKKAYSKVKMIPAYARKYGIRTTYFTLRTTFINQVRKTPFAAKREPKVIMIAHQLDLSGAPYVFVDLAREILQKITNKKLEFHTFNPSHKDNIQALNKVGIKPHIHLSKEISIPLHQDDVVVINTVAHSPILLNGIFESLEAGVAKKMVWYIHEDEPELIFKPYEIKRLKKLLDQNKVFIFTAAELTLKNYQRVFDNTKNIRIQPYKYSIPKKYHKVRTADDFEKLSFILPGTVGDGRKGQMPIFYALHAFKTQYYDKNPEDYRDFELVYVGMSDDFLSRQILKHSKNLLGSKFKHHGKVTHDKSSELIMESNMTVCYSLRECLPLFVFEGMAAGHPILRNDSSGMKEQLIEGKTGFYLDSNNYQQITDRFEEVLNKSKTSNKKLADMSVHANKLALDQANQTYDPIIKKALNG